MMGAPERTIFYSLLVRWNMVIVTGAKCCFLFFFFLLLCKNTNSTPQNLSENRFWSFGLLFFCMCRFFFFCRYFFMSDSWSDIWPQKLQYVPPYTTEVLYSSWVGCTQIMVCLTFCYCCCCVHRRKAAILEARCTRRLSWRSTAICKTLTAPWQESAGAARRDATLCT